MLDCPVPRLTLLFPGATKDVPEAAKMVTAGTACFTSRTLSYRASQQLKVARFSSYAATPE
jgi:hypothetical protein